ncbi:MAG: hypothetical protein ABSF38_12175 [Verrucomicrobiota bacterium]
MKNTTLALLSLLCLGGPALAGTSRLYLNVGTVNQVTNIDATTFENEGNFDLDGISTLDGEIIITEGQLEGSPYDTQNTEHWINTDSGIMFAEPGFIFDDATPAGRHPSKSFYNAGKISGLDTPAEGIEVIISGNSVVVEPPTLAAIGENAAIASLLQVTATNITNSGSMEVGNLGRLTLSGQNVNLATGALIAGTTSDTDTNASDGRGVIGGVIIKNVLYEEFTPPAGVYDLYWGVTNNEPIDLPDLSIYLSYMNEGYPTTPLEIVTNRAGDIFYAELPESYFMAAAPEDFQAYVYGSDIMTTTNAAGVVTITNAYYNIVLVNTAFADTNISASVEFLPAGYSEGVLDEYDPLGYEAMVQFSAPVKDVITGQLVTNSIYLLDVGAIQAPMSFAQNVDYSSTYGKPDCFEITTVTPTEWIYGQELGGFANMEFNTNMIYGYDPVTGGPIYKNATPGSTNGSYAAQINFNPEVTDGLFPLTVDVEFTPLDLDLPTLTNGTGRVEISAEHLNVSNMRLRASGTVTINATNYTGTPAGTDWDTFNTDLGNLKASLAVSNLFPRQFKRLRGDILAYSCDWMNTQTNDGDGHKINGTEHVHLLVVDQALQDVFTSSVLSLALRGSNVAVSDNVVVLQSALFQTPDMTIDGNMHLTLSASDLEPKNMPGLQNLTLTTNGVLDVDDLINIGASTTKAPGNPVTRKYIVNSITNLGSMASGGLIFQPKIFANGGSLVSSNNGAVQMNAKTNLLGAGLGLPNSIVADGDINFSSVSIQASNSTITTGQAGSGQLNLFATAQLTDFLPGVPSTNIYGTNFWTVSAGFTLTNKPAEGDLFGTQITTIAANYDQEVKHIWAGTNLGPTAAGFYNNEVIGHLILDRQTNSTTLRFSGAGNNNAMYVDYLELRDLAYSDYHDGLVVDPNFTIYFANCNFDPIKLTQVYTNIIWVPEFAGPNSSVEVLYKGGSNCIMNALVANSTEISSDYDGVPNSKKEPYILDNPNPYVGTIPCPSTIASTEVVTATNGATTQSLVVWTVGKGVVTPALPGVTVGQTIGQKALPDRGWLFLNWSGAVASSQPDISFLMPPTNAVLTATFIPNPFPALAGGYNGLFYQTNTNGVTASTSGFVSFTLNTNGVFSGHLQINTNKYSFSSRFSADGLASFDTTNGGNILSLTLQLDTANIISPSTQVTGQVSSAGNWDAILIADHAPVWTSKHPAPQAGYYTMILPGNPNTAASPGGDSYGTVTVDKLANLTAVLHLADGLGAGLSQSVPVAASGVWPLYFTPLSGLTQPLLGWVSFNTNAPASFTGQVNWIKAAGPGPYYPSGFDTNAVLQGGIYVGTNILKLASSSITLSCGDLSVPLTDPVTLSGKGKKYESADGSLTLTINQTTGLFSGDYEAAGSKARTPLAGVVLQDQSVARGFFLGTNQSGTVLLQGD